MVTDEPEVLHLALDVAHVHDVARPQRGIERDEESAHDLADDAGRAQREHQPHEDADTLERIRIGPRYVGVGHRNREEPDRDHREAATAATGSSHEIVRSPRSMARNHAATAPAMARVMNTMTTRVEPLSPRPRVGEAREDERQGEIRRAQSHREHGQTNQRACGRGKYRPRVDAGNTRVLDAGSRARREPVQQPLEGASAHQHEPQERDRRDHRLDDAADQNGPPALLGSLAQHGLQAIHHLGSSTVERRGGVLRQVSVENREQRLGATEDHGAAIAPGLYDRIPHVVGRQPLERGFDTGGRGSGSLLRRAGSE